MFFPIRTDRRLESTPWVNYALIAANVLIFLLTMKQVTAANQWSIDHQEINQRLNAIHDQLNGMSSGRVSINELIQAEQLRATRDQLQRQIDGLVVPNYYLQPRGTHIAQFFSYAFLHANWMHLIGNMVFLFIFGNGVEDRLGKIGYLLFYLAGGVLAGLGHLLMSEAPVLGASGAVAAVTGAYLALFPLSNVTIVYWFWFIGAFEVSSMVLILFRVAQDFLFYISKIGNVAYGAHLTGYGFGFLIGMALLLGRLLPREPYDMLALLEQKRRRASFRRMTQRGFQPWDHAASKHSPPAEPNGPLTPAERALMERRARITAAIADHDLPAAARRYVELIESHPDQVMSQQHQLDLANQLMAEGWYDKAAAAYELFLGAYKAYAQKEQVQLILGLIYARYLERPDRAEALLREAMPKLDGENKQLAEQALAEVG